MAKGLYVGVSGVARKIKKIYVGVANVARKAKKIYVGVNGVARLAFSSDPPQKVAVTQLVTSKFYMGGARNNLYAMFGGGGNSAYQFAVAEAYSSTLVKSYPTLGWASKFPSGVSFGQYASFGGGTQGTGWNDDPVQYINHLDDSLTRRATMMEYNTSMMKGAANSAYEVHAGGVRYSTVTNAVSMVNTSLVGTIGTVMSSSRWKHGAANVGQYVVIAGGEAHNGVFPTQADCYNLSGVKTVVSDLSIGRIQIAAAKCGNKALFAGGMGQGSVVNSVVDYYDENLVRGFGSPLSSVKRFLEGCDFQDGAIFAGGYNYTDYYMNTVDYFDSSLTRSSLQVMDTKREGPTVISIGKYTLVGGGFNSNDGVLPTVDAYMIN